VEKSWNLMKINIDQLYTYTKRVVSIASLDSQVAFLWVSPMKMGDSTQAGLARKRIQAQLHYSRSQTMNKRRVVRDYWPEILFYTSGIATPK